MIQEVAPQAETEHNGGPQFLALHVEPLVGTVCAFKLALLPHLALLHPSPTREAYRTIALTEALTLTWGFTIAPIHTQWPDDSSEYKNKGRGTCRNRIKNTNQSFFCAISSSSQLASPPLSNTLHRQRRPAKLHHSPPSRQGKQQGRYQQRRPWLRP